MPKQKWKQIGVVGVDSGQLLVCDPCYIDSQWTSDEQPVDVRRYRDTKTGKVFEWRKDFAHFECTVEPYGKTPNELITAGVWVKLDESERNDFSYAGCCSQTLKKNMAGQLNYAMGHAGVGVAFASGYGDGVYPVFARRNEEGRIVEVRIKMD